MDKVKVHVKFFAIFREYVGLKEDWPEIEPGTTLEALWQSYAARAKNPRIVNIRAAYSVNQRLAPPDTPLQGGEEVGFLPPVSGGAEERGSMGAGGSFTLAPLPPSPPAFISITDAPLDLAALIRQVEFPGAGAIVTFSGVVRDHARGKAVQFLEYEAYPEMAEQTLREIIAEVNARWQEARIAIAHRVGRLGIGEASLLIAASSPHRAEAFAACRYALERVKAILPMWKKEFANDGEYWVEGPVAGTMSPESAEKIATAESR
jgi:molybdopterin synthase catalytic subunit